MRFLSCVLFLCTSLLLLSACEDNDDRCTITRDLADDEITRISGVCTGQSFEGVDLRGVDVRDIVWDDTTCPDGTNSNDNGGTCTGHLDPNADDAPDMELDDPDLPDALNNANQEEPDLPNPEDEDLPDEDTEDIHDEDTEDIHDEDTEDTQDEDTSEPDDPDILDPNAPCVECATTCESTDDCPNGYFCNRGVCAPANTQFVPAGEFIQGSYPDTDPHHEDDETARTTRITYPFFVYNFELTRSLQDVLSESEDLDECGFCPAVGVTWFDAIAAANELSELVGLEPCYHRGNNLEPYNFTHASLELDPSWTRGHACEGWRLPTEAEWEYFTRAGTHAVYHCESNGDDLSCLEASASYEGNSGGTITTVQSFETNPWGLYDTLGNVWEWAWDWYAPYTTLATDPVGPPTGDARVLRGGCSTCTASETRSANRHALPPDAPHALSGVRFVRTAKFQ